MSKLMATVAVLAALTVPALAYDINESGTARNFEGTCHNLSIGEEYEYCFNRLRAWFTPGFKHYLFDTSGKVSENSEIVYVRFWGSQAFIRPEGQPDTFMIDELWITKTVNGKEVVSKERVTGKCVALIENEGNELYLDCKVSSKKFPSVEYKFNGKSIDPNTTKKDKDSSRLNQGQRV